MSPTSFQQELAVLYPELGGGSPDPDTQAASIVVRALNFGSDALTALVIAHYGIERVQAIAIERVNRLDAPTYGTWKDRFGLPVRDEIVERLHRLHRPDSVD